MDGLVDAMSDPVVVVGVNGSPASDAALLVAAELAARFDGRLVVVHVEERSPLVDLNLVAGSGAAALVIANSEMSDGCHLECELALAQSAVDWSFEVRVGHPGPELALTVRDFNAAWLVVGRSARRRFTPRRRSASTIEHLVESAPVPVVVVPARG